MSVSALDFLKPTEKPKVIDLVERAGLNVSDWGEYKGGWEKAGANPRYCYEWCFEQYGMYVFNIWYENMQFDNGHIYQKLNLRARPSDVIGIRRVRAIRFDQAVKAAFETGSNPRIIVLDRKVAGEGSATARLLDESPWTVTKYDDSNGDFEIWRGLVPRKEPSGRDIELEEFTEGEARKRFVTHRKREAQLRQRKIEQHKRENAGNLFCEVPGCGFDFYSCYGATGKDYAQVHHLIPLSSAPSAGFDVKLSDLAVVCANCHAMIHRGGECRDLDSLIPKLT